MNTANSAFSFLKFIDVAPSEVSAFRSLPTLARQVRALQLEHRIEEMDMLKQCVYCFREKVCC